MEFYAHVDDDIMAQWAKSATEALDKRVTALEESRRPKAHAPTIASQTETRWKDEVKHLEAMVDSLDAVIDGLRADIAERNVLVESQARTIKDQAQKLARQDSTISDLISDLRADRDTYVEDLKRRLIVTNADNRRVTIKLSQIREALEYKGDTSPQAHLNHVRRVAGVDVRPTRRFR